ncbi:MAG: flagellar hook-length control protein FliK [Rhodobacteraceae bacterium]|nr:flagellar hook-length control protein FliK [Paracoccaceae bacterium]
MAFIMVQNGLATAANTANLPAALPEGRAALPVYDNDKDSFADVVEAGRESLAVDPQRITKRADGQTAEAEHAAESVDQGSSSWPKLADNIDDVVVPSADARHDNTAQQLTSEGEPAETAGLLNPVLAVVSETVQTEPRALLQNGLAGKVQVRAAFDHMAAPVEAAYGAEVVSGTDVAARGLASTGLRGQPSAEPGRQETGQILVQPGAVAMAGPVSSEPDLIAPVPGAEVNTIAQATSTQFAGLADSRSINAVAVNEAKANVSQARLATAGAEPAMASQAEVALARQVAEQVPVLEPKFNEMRATDKAGATRSTAGATTRREQSAASNITNTTTSTPPTIGAAVALPQALLVEADPAEASFGLSVAAGQSSAAPQALFSSGAPEQTAGQSAAQTRELAAQLASNMPKSNGQTTEIMLTPEELGRVRLSLHSVGDKVVVMIAAERPETVELMRRHMDELERELRAEGFEDVSFEFGGDTAPDQDNEASADTGLGLHSGSETDRNTGQGLGQTAAARALNQRETATPHQLSANGQLDLRL